MFTLTKCHWLGIHFRDFFQGPFLGLQNPLFLLPKERKKRLQVARLVNRVLGQASTVQVINHNNEMKEARFLHLHYFFLKAFLLIPSVDKNNTCSLWVGQYKKNNNKQNFQL